MGLFTTQDPASPSSHATLPPPEASPDGAYIAPDRRARRRCWEARDAFFRCLDEGEIVDSVREEGRMKAERECGGEGRRLEGECAASWVQYFKKRRVMEHNRDQTLSKLKAEGAKQMPGVLPGRGDPGAPSAAEGLEKKKE
ncbi:MAG: hypothetical protein M1827_001729 [Pycnora praestabilis]|nr:MAG: hypothetical protein M1827_001729 [Pycnora praestabilis]